MTLYVRQQKRHRCKEQDFWILWEKVRVGWFERIALKHIYYHMWNRSPVLVRCMRLGAQGWCTGMTLWDGWGGRCKGVSGWRTHVHPWLIHVNVWQKPPQYYKVISLQLKLITEKAMAPHSNTLAWKIPWMEEPGRLQSMGSLRVGHDWRTSLSLFTFMHWRRKLQPTPVFLPGESQGWESLVGWCL